MALLDCTDCGRKVSDQAEACPGCARPVAGWKEGGEAKSIAVGGGVAVSSRASARERPAARLVVLETPAPAASVGVVARPHAPTYRFVCRLCGEDEVLLYVPHDADRHLCGTCEEDALVSGVERRRLLHWWPLALLVALLVGGAFAYQSGVF